MRRLGGRRRSETMTMSRTFAAGAFCAVLVSAATGCSTSAKPTASREARGHGTSAHPRAPTVDPYKAALAFAECMRRHGVPHPDPDRGGNFHLTPRDEALMRRAGRRKHDAAEKACFHFLRPVVSTKPLSRHAQELAKAALRGFSRCMAARGYGFYSRPFVRNLSRGRAFFGFKRTDPAIMKVQRTQRFLRERTACEKKLNAKLDRIISADRGEPEY